MRVVFAIALNTYRESVRSKLLYLIVLFAVLLVLVTTFFGAVSIGDQVKVIKDFGLFAIALFAVLFAVISGTSLLHKELNKKTIYNILGKAVARWQFIVGKQLGMLATITLMIFGMGLALAAYCTLFDGGWDWLVLQACIFIWFEMIIVTAAAMFFSAIVVTPLLAGLFTFALFLVGRSSTLLLDMGQLLKGEATSYIFELIFKVIPRLDLLNISNDVVYGIAANTGHITWGFAYSLLYSAALLCLASIMFSRREFN